MSRQRCMRPALRLLTKSARSTSLQQDARRSPRWPSSSANALLNKTVLPEMHASLLQDMANQASSTLRDAGSSHMLQRHAASSCPS